MGAVEPVAHEAQGRTDHPLPHRLGPHVDEPGVEGEAHDLVGGGRRVHAETPGPELGPCGDRLARSAREARRGMSDIESTPPGRSTRKASAKNSAP